MTEQDPIVEIPANQDAREIDKFNALAERWWDPTSEFKPLHEINPLRVDYIAERVDLAGKKVLDVGAGGGILAESLTKLGANVTAIDLADASLNVAKIHAKQAALDIEYQKISAEEFAAQRPGEFDVITCLETLEHVPDPASMIRACAALAKPGATLFFSTINRNPKAWLFAIFGAEQILKILPKGTHEYKMLVKPSELAHGARNAGLTHVESIGLHYNPLSKTYKLAPGLDVNYMMTFTKGDH